MYFLNTSQDMETPYCQNAYANRMVTEGETANSFIKGESVFARNWTYQWGAIKPEGTITTDQAAVAPMPGGWLLAINTSVDNGV